MKTLKPFNPKLLWALLAFIPLMMTSCTEEESDLRDELTGEYNYTVKIYAQVDEDLVYVGDEGTVGDITGTMRVVKNTSELDVIDFFDGNVLMFHGIHLMNAGNAIVFDIPTQEAWLGPGNFQVTGYDYWNVNEQPYHGAFLLEDDSIEIAFAARVMDVNTGLVMILTAFRK